MGLGLNFVRRIAVAHGWEIELQSQPGKGSEFRLLIPASPDHVTEPASA
jgi:two-component system phosphate regulon sensor histidine kinase PhoR